MIEDVLAGPGLKLMASEDVYCVSLFEKLQHECSLDLTRGAQCTSWKELKGCPDLVRMASNLLKRPRTFVSGFLS